MKEVPLQGSDAAGRQISPCDPKMTPYPIECQKSGAPLIMFKLHANRCIDRMYSHGARAASVKHKC